jgi:hypothetical protein
VKRDVFQYWGAPAGRNNQSWEIVIEQEHQGFSYQCLGAFPGKRYANNEDQALQWAKEDIESGGKQHEWRIGGGGTPTESEPVPVIPEVLPVAVKIEPEVEPVCENPQKSSTLGSLCARVLQWLSGKPVEK